MVLLITMIYHESSFVCMYAGYFKDDHEHKLINSLFKSNYSKEALPVVNKSEAVQVTFDLAYSQLIYLVREWVAVVTASLKKTTEHYYVSHSGCKCNLPNF